MRLYVFDQLRLHGKRLEPLLQPGERALALIRFSLARGADRVVLTPEDLEQHVAFLPAGARRRYADWSYRVRQMERGETPVSQPEPVTPARILVGLLLAPIVLAATALSGPSLDTDRWTRRIWGVSAAGPTGSLAYQVHRRVGPSSEFFLLVTTVRLLVVRYSDNAFAAEVAIPREFVRAAQRQGRPFQHGRVRIDFDDGSFYTAVTGRFDTAQANKIVHALAASGYEADRAGD